MEIMGINLQNQTNANMREMEERTNANMQEMKGEMQNMGISLQAQMKAGQEEMKAELAKVKGEMQTMNWKMAVRISTPNGETTESRGSVDVVQTAMTTGEVDTTSDDAIIKGETHKLEQGMTEINKGHAGFRNNNRNARIRRERRIT